MSFLGDDFEEIDEPTVIQRPMSPPRARSDSARAPLGGPFANWVNADGQGGLIPVNARLSAHGSSMPSRTSPVHHDYAAALLGPSHMSARGSSDSNPAKRMRLDEPLYVQTGDSYFRTSGSSDVSPYLSPATMPSPNSSRPSPTLTSSHRSTAPSPVFPPAYGPFRQQQPTLAPRDTTLHSRGIPVVTGHAAKASQSRPSDAVIDLVSSDEDDLQITGSTGPKKKRQHVPESFRTPDIQFDDSPVCIGQVTSLALVMYPVVEVSGRTENTPQGPRQIPGPSGPMPVRITRAAALGQNETLRVGTVLSGENFAVVEHRVANVLGPFLAANVKTAAGARPVVRCEAAIMRKGEMNPMMLPLHLLLFCHPSYVTMVGNKLEAGAIFLENPTAYNPAQHGNAKYSNPHDTAGMRNDQAERRRRELLSGLVGLQPWHRTAAPQQIKSADQQREQVESVFASLRSGVDMAEKEPPADVVKTPLYRHQKQALTFLLYREEFREVKLPKAGSKKAEKGPEDDDEDMIALWKPKTDTYSRLTGWTNAVTGVTVPTQTPPPQCRGAILADDMGLGKTIVMISLIAASKEEAHEFAQQPPDTSRDTKSHFDAILQHPNSSKPAASSFAVQPWGVNSLAKQKKKEESKTQKKREDAEMAQRARLVARSRATLIVCPLSTIQNWESQIEEHTGGKAGPKGKEKAGSGLSVYVYHGPSRTNDPLELTKYDVVLTTFSTLGSEYSKLSKAESKASEDAASAPIGDDSELEETDSMGFALKPKSNGTLHPPGFSSTEPNTPNASADETTKPKKRRKAKANPAPLQMVEWFRIVLDEAHMIKEHSTIQAKAACELAAQRRTCLTGTPLQNQLDDIFSLIRFLRLEPFTDRAIWNTYIGSPAKLGDKLGVSRLQLVMRHLALRRTKTSKDNEGKPILDLPYREDIKIMLKLSDAERAYYKSHHQRYKHNFEQLQDTDTVMKNYCSILQELLRLRQICDHPDLVRESEDANRAEGDIVEAIKQQGISSARAIRLFALLRDNGSAQCAECGYELGPAETGDAREEEEEAGDKPAPKKRARGAKAATTSTNGSATEESSPSCNGVRRILTRCTHLFCLGCFRKAVCPSFPDGVLPEDRVECSVCHEAIAPVLDAVEVSLKDLEKLSLVDATDGTADKKKPSSAAVEPSTKIRTLLEDLLPFSQANPSSKNYAPNEDTFAYFEEPDDRFRPHRGTVVKSVVFSQWVKLLDKIAFCLSKCDIKFARLDGTMGRVERSRAMQTFKEDPTCEVLLVSLRAGGVGLNLTAAQRVYLMEPFWNPAVEAQALDRVHRLGQTRPVKTKRLIIEQSIEENMLKVQDRKRELANLSLSATISKTELQKQRLADLKLLMKD